MYAKIRIRNDGNRANCAQLVYVISINPSKMCLLFVVTSYVYYLLARLSRCRFHYYIHDIDLGESPGDTDSNPFQSMFQYHRQNMQMEHIEVDQHQLDCEIDSFGFLLINRSFFVVALIEVGYQFNEVVALNFPVIIKRDLVLI